LCVAENKGSEVEAQARQVWPFKAAIQFHFIALLNFITALYFFAESESTEDIQFMAI
jgi:hypothetical protein